MVRKTKWGIMALGALVWACATDGQGDPGVPSGNEPPVGSGTENPFGNGTESPTNGATETPRSGGSETPCNVSLAGALKSLDFVCEKAVECGWNGEDPPIDEGTANLVISPERSRFQAIARAFPMQRTLDVSSDVGNTFGGICQAITLCQENPSACQLEDGASLEDTQIETDTGLVCVTDYIPCLKAIIQALPCDLDAASLQDLAIPAACEGIFDTSYDPPPIDNGTGGGGPG
ncbi:MAG: hypothetical protein KC766_28330 [Myxococcales bacterium]|nr:hypothetical protein [Myxococcales bacterium]